MQSNRKEKRKMTIFPFLIEHILPLNLGKLLNIFNKFGLLVRGFSSFIRKTMDLKWMCVKNGIGSFVSPFAQYCYCLLKFLDFNHSEYSICIVFAWSLNFRIQIAVFHILSGESVEIEIIHIYQMEVHWL